MRCVLRRDRRVVQHLRSTILLLVFSSCGINAAATRQFRTTHGYFLSNDVTSRGILSLVGQLGLQAVVGAAQCMLSAWTTGSWPMESVFSGGRWRTGRPRRTGGSAGKRRGRGGQPLPWRTDVAPLSFLP